MAEEAPRKKILVAQQDPADRNFVQSFLEAVGGFEIIEVASGPDLIHKLKLRPDLILLDTQIKGDVMRVLELMVRAPMLQQTAIAFLSYEQTKIRTCLDKGADGFIIKPCAPESLLAKIWKVMGIEQPDAPAGTSFTRSYRKQLAKIENLPTLPSVYAEVDRICQNPDASADELSEVIETDAPITLKLLKLSNSAFFGFTRKIRNVKDAISLLGNKTVRNSILNISIYEATRNLSQSAGLDRKDFWVHSAGCGSVARFLNEKLRMNREDSFTAGIIHDMGKMILDSLYTECYGEVLRTVAVKEIPIREAEEEILGLDHTVIGHELASGWHLPEELLEAILRHHAPGRAEKDPAIASLVHVSDSVCRRLQMGSGGDALVPEIDPRSLERLGLKPEQLDEWEEPIRETVIRDRAIMAVLN